MLKIKDNVDLKELEKFGFDIDSETREIIPGIWDIDTLYDLIQAGLVEKSDE